MAASKTPHVRLLHIKDELDWMAAHFADMSYEAFAANVVHVRAAERGLLIISEAAKALPLEILAPHPEINWNAVRAIGNALRHDYETIEPSRLWVIVTEHLPALRTVVVELLAKHTPPA